MREMNRVRPIAAASVGAVLIAIGLPLTATSAAAVDVAGPPTVTGTFPADLAKRGALSGHITATFNEPVLVDGTLVSLKDNDPAALNGGAVLAETRVNPLTPNVVEIDPRGKLLVSHTYTANLGVDPLTGTAAVKDVAGNPMAAEKKWTFTVAKSEDDSYVNRVYEHLFNRGVDDNGAAHWEIEIHDVTDDNPRSSVANGITYSTEYRSKLIAGSYARYLGRGTDPTGLRTWLGAMNAGRTISQMESGFIASNEYFGKAGSTNAGWVTTLYKDVLGRAASPVEVAKWKTQLDKRLVSRSKVAMGFLLSPEHLGSVVDDHYQHLLGRGLDPTGRRSWVTMLGHGGRDEKVIGNIISSVEFYGHS